MILDHIGIAVKNIDDSTKIWRDILGFALMGIIEVPLHNVRIAFFQVNGVKIELLEPLNEQSTVHKFIKERGEGLHHVCFEVEDIIKALENMKKEGMKLIDEVPRKGVEAGIVAFIHPRDTGGVLIELCEKKTVDSCQ